MRWTYILLVSILGTQALAAAESAFKNGQPCMDGLCIGDGLAEVARIKWDPAVVHVPFEPKVRIASYQVKDKRRAEVARIYRGDLTRAMPYLAGSGFDQTAVPALEGVVACQHRGGIAGTFTGKDGSPTVVGLTLLPDVNDPKVQRWTVTNFERHFLDAKTEQQQDAVRAELNERYAAVAGNDVKPRQGRFHMSGDRAYLTMNVGAGGYAALKMHPLCVTRSNHRRPSAATAS